MLSLANFSLSFCLRLVYRRLCPNSLFFFSFHRREGRDSKENIHEMGEQAFEEGNNSDDSLSCVQEV